MTNWLGFWTRSPRKLSSLERLHLVRKSPQHDIGATARGVIKRFFCTVFFLGINDCGGVPGEDLSSLVDVVFDAIHQLYIDVNARNFILVDVPPTDRSPAGKCGISAIGTISFYMVFSAAGTTIDIASRIEEWNDSLVTHASDFVSNNTQATMLVFSSHKVLSEILDNPGAYGFVENAKSVVGRGIWWDILHLTPAVHKIIANRISSVLGC